MRISSISAAQLRAQLKRGLAFRTGAFTIKLQTSSSAVVQGIALLYADYPIVTPDFADFHVKLNRPSGLRRFIRPQTVFSMDGYTPFKPLPSNQAFPLLEWGMNWCVSSNAHHYLIIHAAVIERNGVAVILPAPPGSGKSTLCAALIHSGWRLLSDELTLIRLSDGMIAPLPRPVSLKNRSIAVIRAFIPGAIFSPEVNDTVKGTVAHLKAPSDSVLRAAELARPAWFIFPKYQEGAATQLTAIPKAHAFIRVADNAFNYSLLGIEGFKTLSKLIHATAAYDFTYSNLPEAIQIFAELSVSANTV